MNHTSDKVKKTLLNPYFIIIFTGLAVRLAATRINAGYYTDINCFKSWANMLFSDGFSKFYISDAFTDYPPGYMYVLFVIGFIRSLFDLNFSGYAYTLLIKLPAIFCDVAAGVLLYNFAAKRLNTRKAFAISAAYLLNPAILINSSVWGQVDSIYTLVIFISIFYITEKKLMPSFLLFTLGVLLKPQALIFTPIYIYAFFEYLAVNNFNKRVFTEMFKYLLFCLLFATAAILPFTDKLSPMPVINQYINTLQSYPYATINAYNFYALIGANWKSVTETFLFTTYTMWGIIFLDVIVMVSILLLMRNNSRSNYFFVAALINTLTFMFSMRMHERYLFPSLLFLLAAVIYKPNRKLINIYALFSVTLFVNCLDVLKIVINGNNYEVIKDTLPFISFINICGTIYMLAASLTAYKKDGTDTEQENIELEDTEQTNTEQTDTEQINLEQTDIVIDCKIEKSAVYPKITALDFKLLIPLIVIYSIIAFYNLGDTVSPQTVFTANAGDEITVDFGEVKSLSRIQYMSGARIKKQISFSFSSDGNTWYDMVTSNIDSVFVWKEIYVSAEARYVTLQSHDPELMLNELAFRDSQDKIIPVISSTGGSVELFDEQLIVPEKSSFMNSMYFDEIYHARTAYEFIHKLSAYEWTHPPMGKNIISLGIKIFGMTPFGWRSAGTFIGVLMIPLIYFFARSIFKSSYWAFFAAFIFSFDFMHFAQTRIATIDSYVTFFIIGMYYFMYLYANMSFYDKALYKTFIPLGISGIFTGFAVASKWQGVYAAAGLAVIFFYTIYKRLREYLNCKKQSPENTEAEFVVNVFYKNTIATIGFCLIFFIAIPLGIYCLSYIPFLNTPLQDGINTIIKNQRDMFYYHAETVVSSTHPYSSHWWQWPFNIRPILYYSGIVGDNLRSSISSFGNPAVWWCGIAAVSYCVSCLSKRKNINIWETALFLLIGAASQYIPWVLVSRSTYIYHYFPCVPFLVLMIAQLFKNYNFPRRKTITIAYAVLAAVLFIAFYPVISGMPVNPNYVYRFLKWLPTWQLI